MSDLHENAGFIAPDSADLAPFFPGYEIQGLIATGGMGAVYCAVQKSLDRTVALKILPMEFSKDAAFCAGFESEAKAMARLNHPNLIGVYDFGEANGMLYIIMEFVPGKSLYHSAYGIAIASTEVISLVTGICNGLAHAHENGIIHRDIKPSNILLDLQAQPKIGDFGLASPIDRKFQEGEIIYGTPHYTAPEVVNSPHNVDYRADIFSVGVLLHELLTGKLPANDSRPASAICRCDPRFDTIIRRATQPLPAARYSSASQIAADLDVIAKSLVPAAPRTAAIAPGRAAGISPARRVMPRRTGPVKVKKSSNTPLIIMLLAVGASIVAITYFSKKTPGAIIVPVPIEKNPVRENSEKPVRENSKKPKIPGNKFEPESITRPHDPTPPEPERGPAIIWDKPPEIETETATEHKRPDTTPTEPKFDVDEFLGRALKIMQERANPLITKHQESLSRNVQDYGALLLRQIRRLEIGKFRVKVQNSLDLYILLCKDRGNRIPEQIRHKDLPQNQIKDIEKFSTYRDDFIEKEAAIDKLLLQSLSQLTPTYILGLEKQIQRLKPENDSEAIEFIKAEIEKSRSDQDYFPNLITDAHIPKKDSNHNEEENSDSE